MDGKAPKPISKIRPVAAPVCRGHQPDSVSPREGITMAPQLPLIVRVVGKMGDKDPLVAGISS